ncbi:MAG: leucine-rich repeat domain-containing protein [Candidatus Poribacteria bacterium]|nr:leucine-rich repeat domain-containing protein [Candidatus Poribacteria bacterium]
MKSLNCLLIISLLSVCENGYTQNNTAQNAYLIFEKSCVGCHSEGGAFAESLIIDWSVLLETGAVVPGSPEGSELYRRLLGTTERGAQMPFGQPPLSDEAIATIRSWILAGAPDWNVLPETDRRFITDEVILDNIHTHLQSLTPFDRASARYFTLTHLYNAGDITEDLQSYSVALSKLVNSLSWGFTVVRPKPINPEQTIFYIDLRNYEWDKNDAWTKIEQRYSYRNDFEGAGQTGLRNKLSLLQDEMECEVPVVHIDWFLATASQPPLYNEVLGLPETDRELETHLGVNVAQNIKNNPGVHVWRAGFTDSGVSTNNRVVERHTSLYGAYWKSYDFAGSVGKQNIFVHPMSFNHDGGEVVFNLPNGLQAYYLSDARGNRLGEAPVEIVSNPAASDPTVRNGISCIGCHTEGMKTFEDEVRQAIEQAPSPLYDRTHALRLYVEKDVMDILIEFDKQRYQIALTAATGETISEIEPISRFYERFNGTLDAAHAAASLGLRTENFLEKIQQNFNLQRLGLGVLETGEIKRDTWTSNFKSILFALRTPPAPTHTDITRAPDDVVYIPDPNLRKALAQLFVATPIKVHHMESVIEFGVHRTHLQDRVIEGFTLREKGIKDLTGLAYAKNLITLSFSENEVSDLSPIAGLSELRELRFVNNNVSDLSPLAGLTQIRGLVMEHNPISDLSPLAGLTELEQIQFSHNFLVTDISALAGKEKLREVLMWGPPIKDMSPLANLPNIKIIDLCGNEISEIPFLGNAPNLKHLYLVDNDISDVSVLQNLTGLERLNLRDNNITDVSPLANLTNLKWLDIRDNPITNYSVLRELSKKTKIEGGGFDFTANANRVGVGDTFTFDINAQFIHNLVGWECNIAFDTNLLEAIEVTEGDFLSQDGTATLFTEGTIDNESGIISGYNVLRLDGKGVNGSGALLSIQFRAKKVGTAVFTPGSCYLGDSEGEEIWSGAPRLEIEIVEQVSRLPEAPLSETATEDEVFTGSSKDVNRDGVVNILDMILVSKHIGKPVSDAPRTDINGDGIVNILDLVAIAGNLDG